MGKVLYALAATAQKLEGGVFSYIVNTNSCVARNQDEAIGIGLRWCKEKFPEPYVAHQVSVAAIPRDVLRAVLEDESGEDDE